MRRIESWIVVADASRARFFGLSDDGHLVSIGRQNLVGSNLRTGEIGSDRPGRVYESVGGARHAAEPSTDPKRHAKFELAHEICDLLDAERKKQSFERLVVVAPPQFLGDLRALMSEHVKPLIIAEVNKDLSKLAGRELEAQLVDVLPRH